jgi:hypothetical protein
LHPLALERGGVVAGSRCLPALGRACRQSEAERGHDRGVVDGAMVCGVGSSVMDGKGLAATISTAGML